jgi:hypothetical protein
MSSALRGPPPHRWKHGSAATAEGKRRSAGQREGIDTGVAHLRGLDLKGLRSRWQSVFQNAPPDRLPRHLLFAIIAYRIQADRLGDLNHETKQVLDLTDAKNTV